jgi:hypothetical protein
MRSILVVLALLVTIGTAWADVVGTWKTGQNQTLKVSYRDKDNIRMDAGAEGYMLVTGDKVYMVSQRDGKWTAMDMDEMGQMMKLFGHQAQAATGKSAGKTSFKPTGRKETVAGYKGEVYRVIHTDSSGKKHEQEVVLSNHPDVKELNQSWVVLASRMAQIMGKDAAAELKQATEAAREQGVGGMIRAGDDMVLQSLEKKSLKASHYKLPKGVEMAQMPNMGGGAAPQAGGQGTYGGSQQPSAAGEAGQDDFVSDTTDEFADAAKDEAKESAKDSMRKAIRGLW